MTDLTEYEKHDRSSLCLGIHTHTESIYVYISYINILLPSICYTCRVMLKIVIATGSLPYDTNNKPLFNF